MSLPPSGEIPQGAIRFNTDSQRLEFYAQGEWWIMSTDTPNLGRGVDSTPGARGVFMGGQNEPSPNQVFDIIDYINISSTGDAVDFGDMAAAEQEGASLGGHIRGFYFGGDPADNEIETLVFATKGDATDYGDLASNSKSGSGTGNRNRGIAFLGNAGNVINYFALASTGSGIDFGDATTNASSLTAACGSPTRVIVGGGTGGSNVMGFVTISTLGNTQDFGDLMDERGGLMAASNPVRGLFAGGFAPSDGTNLIDYITISTLGDATNFGDLTRRTHYAGSSSSSTRMVVGGGDDHPNGGNYSNIIDYVEFATEGDAVDFGDLTQGRRHVKGASNANGGL